MGLLDGAMSDPGTMGLLSGGAAMLNASGPSIMPHSLGQIIGQGVQGAQDGYKNSIGIQQQSIKFQMEQQQLLQAVRQGKITADMYDMALQQLRQQTSPSDQPAAPATTLPDQPQTAPAAPQSAPLGAAVPSAPQAPIAQQTQANDSPPSQQMQSTGSGAFGLNASGVLGGMMAGPAKFGEAIMAANSPTDMMKQLRAAGIDPNSGLGRQFLQANLAKQNYIAPLNARPGSIVRDPLNPSKILAFNPHIPDGGMPQFDSSGNITGITALPGAAGVMQGVAAATAAGKNSMEPMAGVDGNGVPVYTNKTIAASGGGAGLPTMGDRGSWNIPGAVQDQRNATQMQILRQELADPKNTPQDTAALQRQLAGLNGPQSSPVSQQAAVQQPMVRPAAPAGFVTSQDKLAGAAADRYNGLINQASDSNTRVNVYDNILGLSKEGVQTGPSAAWANKVKGYVASVPGVDSMFPGMKKDVSNYQEINKFMYQNAQRNWQAAGGTGTDSQLEAFSRSSPNESMFPQALQAMAQWGKAGELALQGKTNAMQTWKDNQGGNVANLDQFDRTWRNNFDPVIFQLKTMDPAQAQQYVANLKAKNPSAYSNLMLKSTALKNIGGL